jgi:RHS repeat-associated protein
MASGPLASGASLLRGLATAAPLAALLVAGPARGVTAPQLADAIGPAALHFEAISLRTTSGVSPNTIEVISDNQYQQSWGSAAAMADMGASPGPFAGSILISTGKTGDRGLGDTDWGDDGLLDETTLGFTIARPPPGAKYLVFTLQFVSGEFADRGWQDRAVGTTQVTGPSPIPLHTTRLGGVASCVDRYSPRVTRVVRVDSLTPSRPRRVTFSVADYGDGRYDSALLLSRVYFTEKELAVPGQPYSPYGDALSRPEYNLTSGSCTFSKELFSAPGRGVPFNFTVYYSSSQIQYGNLGRKWRHSYDWCVTPTNSDSVAVVTRGDGGREYFWRSGTTFVPEPGVNNSLQQMPGGYSYETLSKLTYSFDDSGRLIAIADRNGLPLQLFYGSNAKLASIEDTRGNTASFSYDPQGRISRVDYATEAVTFGYDAAGNLSSFTERGALTTRFTYDEYANLLTATNADNVRFMDNEYLDNRLVVQRDGKGAETHFDYEQGAMRVRNRLGQEKIEGFDIKDRMTEHVEVSGARWTFAYDERDNPVRKTAPNLGVTEMEYDARGNLLKKKNALGQETALEYTSTGSPSSPTKITDPAGLERQYEYDTNGNMTRELDPTGTSIQYTYTTEGRLATVTDRNGNVSSYQYTAEGDLRRILQPATIGGDLLFAYDQLGRQTEETDPEGNKTTYVYGTSSTRAGRIEQVIDAEGHHSSFDYDADGRRKTITNPVGAVTNHTYTPTGQVATTTDPEGRLTRFEYDAEDRLIARTDALGRTTRFDYDAVGHLIGVTDPAGNHIGATYDAMGRRLSFTDARGNLSSFTYDVLGRMTSTQDPLGNRTSYSYDNRGSLRQVITPRGNRLSMGYDGLGRLDTLTAPTGTILHALDGNGNRVVTQCSGRSTSRGFDALNRMTRRTDELGRTLRYAYNRAGDLIQLTYSDGKQVTYGYDKLHRLIRVTDWAGHHTDYTYDAAGNLTDVSLPDGAAIHHDYDLSGLTTASRDVARDTILAARYRRDPLGVPQQISGRLPLAPSMPLGSANLAYDGGNRLTAVGSAPFTYDAEGNLTRGPLLSMATSFQYDAFNRLTQAGADSYRYDADGLRIEARRGDSTVTFVQDPSRSSGRMLEEYDANGVVIARYVYGRGLISRQDRNNQFRVYHFDSQGNTIALTDGAGIITDRYAYDPYGNIVGRQGGTPNPFTFCGRFGVVDDGNGLYFARSRYYVPELMRFIQRDQLSGGSLSEAATLNPYAYAAGNPIFFTDPDGDSPQLIGAIVGAVVGVGIQLAVDWITGEEVTWGQVANAAIAGAFAGATFGVGAGASFAMCVGGATLGNVTEQVVDKGADKCLSGGFDVRDFALDVGISVVTFGVTQAFKSGAAAGEKAASRTFTRRMAISLSKEEAAEVSKTVSKMLYKAVVKDVLKDAAASAVVDQAARWVVDLLTPTTIVDPEPVPAPVPYPHRQRERVDP